MRVSAQLIEAASGHHVWAEQFDRTGADTLALQDEITQSIAASVQTQVILNEGKTAKSAAATPGDRVAVLLARSWQRFLGLTADSLAEAKGLAERALQLDDHNSTAHRMVAAANRIFSGSTMAGQFATLVVGRASRDGSVELVSAGHLPVLHLSGAETKSQGATGVPLGMFANASFPVIRFSIASGETLLIYTDGMTEARNPGGEEYGMQRVKASANAQRRCGPADLLSHCLSDLGIFTAGTRHTDDLTVLAVQRAA